METQYNIIRRVRGEKAGRIMSTVRGEASAQASVRKNSTTEVDSRYEWVYAEAKGPVKPTVKTRW